MLSQTEARYWLSNARLFNTLGPPQIEQFARVAIRRSFSQGETLLEAGRREDCFAILTKGRLRVFLPKQSKGRSRVSNVTLNELSESDCLGEYALIDESPSSASVVALSDGEMIAISKSEFLDILSADATIARTIYYNLSRLLLDRVRKREREYDLG